MSVSLPAHASPLSPDADLTYSTLAALEELYRSDATPEKRLLWRVIQTLAQYIRYAPIPAQNQDLSILLAVSVALERARGPRR